MVSGRLPQCLTRAAYNGRWSVARGGLLGQGTKLSDPGRRGAGRGKEQCMVLQIVRASIKPEQREHWLEVIRGNAARTRAEEGCEGYQIAEDLEAPNTFVIIEQWANLDAVYRHLQNEFETLMAALGDVFAAPPEAWIHDLASTLTLDEVLAKAGLTR